MHSYLRAIGFSKIKNKGEQNKLITAALNSFTDQKEIEVSSGTKLVQINKQYGNNIGIYIITEVDQDNTMHVDHIFPYCLGTYATSQSDIQIEPYSDREAYSAISDNYNLGITLIYALQNIVDYIKCTWLNDFYRVPKKVYLGALSTEGTVLYGIHLEHMSFPYDKQPISNKQRSQLIEKAKLGDMDALEHLTLDDMDTYSLVTKRIKEEDLLTVVETYFMPYGINNEQYAILGIIRKIEQITNEFSGELVYNLTICCNDVMLNVVINSVDLKGVPEVGRRFKGIIWLQGKVNFL